VTRTRSLAIVPAVPSKSKAWMTRGPLSARYIVPPSGLQAIPLEMVNPPRTGSTRPSRSSRYTFDRGDGADGPGQLVGPDRPEAAVVGDLLAEHLACGDVQP
jgi:hypothetical protein